MTKIVHYPIGAEPSIEEIKKNLPVVGRQLKLDLELEPKFTMDEITATGIAFYYSFNQGKEWIDIDGRIWPIREMESSHLANVITFLRKRAESLFFFYGWGDAICEAEAKERHDIPLVVEQFDDATEWLMQTRLIKAIEAEIDRRHKGVSFGTVVDRRC